MAKAENFNTGSANITPGTTCDRQCKGQFRTRIITGCVVGFVFVLAFGCLLLFFYKRKKLRLISLSSKSMVQKEDSDQYFHDLEMVGSEYTQIFSYEDLHQATEGFSKSKELGDGGFGIYDTYYVLQFMAMHGAE
ncbi:wall-associated kinase 1 [Carex littledalei]|uniref:Wall-associated kinase 1 n=1 Tax=Carex littledalei TaxID=544730 RepID=A0A833VZN8_9POAL|nr:wall-associated kinase 1 [Carex littledalei]